LVAQATGLNTRPIAITWQSGRTGDSVPQCLKDCMLRHGQVDTGYARCFSHDFLPLVRALPCCGTGHAEVCRGIEVRHGPIHRYPFTGSGHSED